MGKRLEKTVKDKNQTGNEGLEEDPNKTPEPYNCTGNFQADFSELCRRNNMYAVPPVVLRPRPPAPTAIQMSEGKPEKGKDKNKVVQPEPEPEPELNEDGEPIDPPPKTYTVKDKFEYFKPNVQVEMDNPEKPDTVSEVYVRGFRVDEPMMNTFRQCWPVMDKLHTINLWQVGLTGETLSILAAFMPVCANVKNLILDGNTVKEDNWFELIGEDSLIQNLSLRNCGITDKGAEGIGKTLGSIKKANTKLISLNLSGNKLTDSGGEHIANGLRMNRSLFSLSLANNQIGDKGTSKIAEVLSRFPLTHEEVVERRRMISEKGSPERNKSPPPSRRADSKDRPGSVRSTSHAEKDKSKAKDKPATKKKDGKSKDGKEEEKHDKTKKKDKDDKGASKKGGGANVGGRSSGASIAADAGKTAGKGKDRKGKTVGKGTTVQDTEPDAPDFINPLLEVADFIETTGQLLVSGNRILINLNLSRNRIGEIGMSALLKAVQYQTTLTHDSKNSGTGLMRLLVNRNCVSMDNDIVKKLNELMAPKDPFYKPPPASPEGDAA